MLRVTLFACLTLAFMVANLPAGLMDRIIAGASDGRLRLGTPTGSFWQGHGMLAITDAQRRLIAARAVDWRFGIDAKRIALTLDIAEHGHHQAQLRLSPDGGQLAQLNVDLPLAVLSAAIDHPAARAGWRGALGLASSGLSCDWHARCDGAVHIRWNDAGLDIVPERHLGNHEIILHARGETLDVVLTTLDGDLRINGRGTLDRNGQATLQATLTGDPDIVDRLPNIMDRNARLQRSGEVLITLP